MSAKPLRGAESGLSEGLTKACVRGRLDQVTRPERHTEIPSPNVTQGRGKALAQVSSQLPSTATTAATHALPSEHPPSAACCARASWPTAPPRRLGTGTGTFQTAGYVSGPWGPDT